MTERMKSRILGIAKFIGIVLLLVALNWHSWLVAICVICCFVAILYLLTKIKLTRSVPVPKKQETASKKKPTIAISAGAQEQSRCEANTDGNEVPSVEPLTKLQTDEHSAPPVAIRVNAANWLGKGAKVTIGGVLISDGMVYVGISLKNSFNELEPCLIDSRRLIDSKGDFTKEVTINCECGYSDSPPPVRRAYLNWLADGKKHPESDLFYVFLYFRGLERRVIVDIARDLSLCAELPIIGAEVTRLLEIYGNRSTTFPNCASVLLEWIGLICASKKLDGVAVPEFHTDSQLPGYLRLALGQMAMAGLPIPAKLALKWVRRDPNSCLRATAIQLASEFAKLFKFRYRNAFGEGLVLPKTDAKLKLFYKHASLGNSSERGTLFSFGDAQDVSGLTGQIDQLRQLAQRVTDELEGCRRYLDRAENRDVLEGVFDSIEGLVQLPYPLWPVGAQKVLKDIKSRIGAVGMIEAIKFHDLVVQLGGNADLSRNKVQRLARTLESVGIAMEPDVVTSAVPLKLEDKIILFSVEPRLSLSRDTPAYQAALLTLQLACVVASADGEFSDKELAYLQRQVQAWSHLTESHRQRLLVHLKLRPTAPLSLQSLNKRLHLLAESKETIAVMLANVAQADGAVSPAEVKILEKVYRALEIDAIKVFSDLHAAATGTVTATSAVENSGEAFTLDQAFINALQEETEEGSKVLAAIFTEEEQQSTTARLEPTVDEISIERDSALDLLGLDGAHIAFVRQLLSRPQWTRQALVEIAKELDLMLDGALEFINEASYDAYDVPFTEGDDPIEVNTEILEKLKK